MRTGSDLRRRAARGMTLLELMIAMFVLAVGILGVAQLQVMASAQNNLARRTGRAAAVLRDFTEVARRWNWGDPRLAPSNPGTCASFTPDMRLVENAAEHSATEVPDLGYEETPRTRLQYTALPASSPVATRVATTTDALTLNGMRYSGNANALLAQLVRERYQLAWTVFDVDTNNNTADGCEARLVNIVVRYPVGHSSRFRSAVTHFVQYDPTRIFPGEDMLPGGLPEPI